MHRSLKGGDGPDAAAEPHALRAHSGRSGDAQHAAGARGCNHVCEGQMNRWSLASDAVSAPPDVDWTITVTEPLPDCPSVAAAWERIATQSKWGAWRSESKMRGRNVVTTVVPPATEPLKAGDAYVVKVGRFLTIRCRVLESLGDATEEHGERVFDATGVALGGLVRARFRFTVFRGDDGVVMARAQERIALLPLVGPSKETLANEHRHTFSDLNASFRTELG